MNLDDSRVLFLVICRSEQLSNALALFERTDLGRARHPPGGAAGDADAQHLCGHKSCPLNPRESIFCRLHIEGLAKRCSPGCVNAAGKARQKR